MRGKMMMNGRKYSGVYLLMRSEEPGEKYDATGAIVEIHMRRGTDDYFTVAVLFGASVRIHDQAMIFRGFFRSGQDQEDTALYIKSDQEHRSALVEFVPYGPDDQDTREAVPERGPAGVIGQKDSGGKTGTV